MLFSPIVGESCAGIRLDGDGQEKPSESSECASRLEVVMKAIVTFL
jgi:hypothetical protein